MDYASLVDGAVKKFYSEGNNEAHSWLLRAQAAPEAWTFVWQLLEPSKSWEVQFFAATTLHSKILKQWNEVPTTEYPALKDRLISCIKQETAPKFILAKLCQALAVFLAKISSTQELEKRKYLVDELVEILPYDSPTSLELLLHVLIALPEQFPGAHSSFWKVTWLLQQVFTACNPNAENSNESLYLLALECALSWLKLEYISLENAAEMYPYLLEAAPHFAPSRDALDTDNTRGWEIVQECLTILVTNAQLHRQTLTIWEWAKRLINLATLHSNNYFCEVIAAMGDQHSREILIALVNDNEERKWISETLIRLLLECLEQPGRYPTEETRSCIPFGFWYSLQDSLVTLDEPLESRAQQALKPIYARLAHGLLEKSKLPNTTAEAGTPDERELFRCYRQDVTDTFLYCYNILGDELVVLLGQRLSQPLNSPEKWTDVETTLHAFKALADCVDIDESKYMPALMELVLSDIPYDLYPGEVLACACSTLGAYAEWIGQHPGPILEKVLKIVALGLTRGSETIPLSSMALKDLTRECSAHLGLYAPSILTIISEMLPNVSSDGGENLRLVYAAGKLLNTLPTVDEQLAHLNATLGPCIVKIRELLEQPLFRARDSVTNQLKMITMLFQTLEGMVGQTVLDTLLPIFRQIIEHHEWSQDNATLEAMYLCAKSSLCSLVHPEINARPLLPILSTSYKKWPHPEALNFFRHLILLFSKEWESVIGPVFAELSSITLCGIIACRSVRGDLADWSELIEAYLYLLASICKKKSEMLLSVADQIPEMLQCGISCLLMWETRTVKAAGSFLSHVIKENPLFENYIEHMCQDLVNAIVQCIAGEVPRHSLEPHADILLSLKKSHPKLLHDCLRLALQEKVSVATNEKYEFLRQVTRLRLSKHRLFDILKEFSLKCRQQTIGL